jgi:hypothetical protein
MSESPVRAPSEERVDVLSFPAGTAKARWGGRRDTSAGAHPATRGENVRDLAVRPEPPSARIHALRRACLRAVARLHDQPEPMSEECDRATWEAGLSGAYRSIRKARMGAHVQPDSQAAPVYRPPYVWLVPLAASAFFLELALAPFNAFWETHGHVAPEALLGVPNAPANPLFAALARVWMLVLGPFTASLDVQLTLFALLPAAALAGLTFLFLHRTLWPVASETAGTLPFALGLSLLGASGLAAWGSSHASRSAVLLDIALLIAATWLLWRWRDRRTQPKRIR